MKIKPNYPVTNKISGPRANFKYGYRFLMILSFLILLSWPLQNDPILAQSEQTLIYLPLILRQEAVSAQNCSPGAEQWLCLLNQYRDAAGLAAVSHDAGMSDALNLHTHYMLLNAKQVNFHKEYPDKPGYTILGEIAGGQSNMAGKQGTTLTQQESMDAWIGYPSHRYHMLHPDLVTSGFALSCDLANCFSGLNIQGNLPPSYQISSANVIYPGDNQTNVPAEIFPISWGFYMPWIGEEGDAQEAVLLSGKLFDQTNQPIAVMLSEPNHTDGNWEYRNQVVMTPIQPLLRGQTYRVEMSVRFLGQVFNKTWHFSTR